MDENDESDQFDGCMDDPAYLLMARQAEMYAEGSYGLEKDPTRAGEMVFLLLAPQKNALMECIDFFELSCFGIFILFILQPNSFKRLLKLQWQLVKEDWQINITLWLKKFGELQKNELM